MGVRQDSLVFVLQLQHDDDSDENVGLVGYNVAAELGNYLPADHDRRAVSHGAILGR
jgi:hypothetical protein